VKEDRAPRLAPLLVILAILGLLWSAGSSAQSSTAGGLSGTVTDDTGAVLPGATVELSGPAMQGARVSVTDGAGRYRLVNVPPGDRYRAVASLAGFQSLAKADFRVSLGQEATVNFSLTVSLAESITVTADAPLVDVSRTTTGVNVTARQFESLPTARSFQALTAIAPGVSMEMADSRPGALENSPAVGASSAPENNYIIDGLSTTDIQYGTSGTNLTMNFVEEVQVMTGGYPAEYGRSTGGVFNVITKSGGNQFHGDVFAYIRDSGWSSSATRVREKPITRSSNEVDDRDVGFSLGGPIIRDRLWFFGAYDPTQRTTYYGEVTGGYNPVVGRSREFKRSTDFYAAKLTFAVAPNHSLVATTFGDPQTREEHVTKPEVDESVRQKIDEGTKNYNLHYTGVFSTSFLLEGNVGRAEQDTTTQPFDAAAANTPRQVDETGGLYWYGGFPRVGDQQAKRDSAALKLAAYLGTHELKVGADYERNEFDSELHERWYRYYGQTAPASSGCTLTEPVNGSTQCWQLRSQTYDLNGSGKTDNQAFFVQDQWRALPNLQINLGLRYEIQKLTSAQGVRVGVEERHVDTLTLDDNWAPRLGIVWDPLKNGRSKVFVSAGRFFEAIPLDLNLRAINGEVYDFERFVTATPITGSSWVNANGDPLETNGWTRYRRSVLDSYTPLDADLKAQYQDEYVIGGEYQFGSAWALGVRYVNRQLKRVIEDFGVFANPDDPLELTGYIIGNPGEGTFGTPFDEPKRKYEAIELTLARATRDNWQLNFSYVYARATGNYEGLYLSGYEQLDPNITAYYDIPSMLNNADGKLRADKPYVFKVFGSYAFPFGLTVSEGFLYSAGIPYDKRGPEIYNGYGDGNIFFEPRGSAGRTPDYWSLDLHAAYTLPFFKTSERGISLIVDVFNATNNHEVLEVDSDYIYEGMDPAVLALWESEDNLDANGNPMYDPSLPHSEYYGTPILYQSPRVIQVGVKLTF
jgi:outer membrane receptor protein involved in Fe transport